VVFIHGWDSATDEAEWRSFLDSHPFGELVAAGAGRAVPVVVPTQFAVESDTILVHLLRQNPVWTAIGENPTVMLCVSGDWAFIPSNWKVTGDEDPLEGIPTTYYASVQLTGTARVIDDPDGVAEVLRVQLRRFQPEVDVADPSSHGARLRAITALTIEITDVRAKFKYGGNVDIAHRTAVAGHLEARRAGSDLAAARHVRRRLGGAPA